MPLLGGLYGRMDLVRKLSLRAQTTSYVFARLPVSSPPSVGLQVLMIRHSHGTGHGVGHYLNVHEGTSDV